MKPEYDRTMLASKHIEYKRVKLTFMDAGYITKLYPHPPSFKVVEQESSIVVRGKRRVFPLLILPVLMLVASVALIASTPFAQSTLLKAIFTSFVPIIQCGIALLFPSTLFGKWRGDAYREKLEWDAFTRPLCRSQIA